MNPVVIVPTYISERRVAEGPSLMETYDHTTPITTDGELPRLLTSLEKVNSIGFVIILVAAPEKIAEQAAKKVELLASGYTKFRALVIGQSELDLIRQRMMQLGANDMIDEIGLVGYGAIRNLGLVVANTLGFDAAVFLDDDEIVDDEAFLSKAVYGLGKLTKKGIPILAKSGYYLNRRGSYLAQESKEWYDKYWQQASAFNTWIKKAMEGPRLSRSNYVCGGCLALHKEAFKRVAFDPWVPRGEDLDYMLNLRMYGSDMWFDNQWVLHHQPPKTASEGVRFRQDVYRWLYEYRKMEYSRTQIDLMQVKPSSLNPYPGPFLDAGVRKRIQRTAQLRSLGRPDKTAYREAAKVVANEASEYADANCTRYFAFQYVWSELMNRMDSDQVLATALVQSVANRQIMAGLGGVAPTDAHLDPGMTTEIRLNLAD